MRRRWVESSGLRLAVYEQGEPDAPTVLLVHGYPDNASVWDAVAELLSSRFHVVRYDVRGHGESDAPAGRAGYRIEHLVGDLVAVAQSVGSPVHLVAHDWGSGQAWAAVADPALRDLFHSYTSISGPDLEQTAVWMRSGHRRDVLRQVAHSWYVGVFQVPLLPELVWRVRPLRARFGARYRDAANGLQLYRANLANRMARPEPKRTSVPVQQLALTNDAYVTPALLESADPWCERLWRRELVADHWAIRSKPAAVVRMIEEFVDHLDGAPASRELARARVGADRAEMSGQLALVTGAGSGIGRATALALAEAGAGVVCVDIDLEAAKRTAGEVGGHAYQLDVADGDATHRLAEQVRAEHGVPDLVMANAGIGVAGSFLDTSEEDWRRVLDVNLWGVIHTLRAFVPPLVERGEGGHVVVTASAAGYLPSSNLPAYSTTKAGVLMLAQCLAGELAPHGIGVSAICPGIVHTNITATTRFAGADPADEQTRRVRATELYRRRGFGPEKVAEAVLDAVRDNRLVVPVTPEAKLGALGVRFAPAATRAIGRFLDRQAARQTES